MKDYKNTFIDETDSSPPVKNYPTNKTIGTFIDDIWSSDLLDLVEYSPPIKKG